MASKSREGATKALLSTVFGLLIVLGLFESCGAECSCAALAIELSIVDGDNVGITPDAVSYTCDGEKTELDPSQLRELQFVFVGSRAGVYRIWVTYGDQTWESDDIEVEMGGPANCRRPATKTVTVKIYDTRVDAMTANSPGVCH